LLQVSIDWRILLGSLMLGARHEALGMRRSA
jgi:hypothetical protein